MPKGVKRTPVSSDAPVKNVPSLGYETQFLSETVTSAHCALIASNWSYTTKTGWGEESQRPTTISTISSLCAGVAMLDYTSKSACRVDGADTTISASIAVNKPAGTVLKADAHGAMHATPEKIWSALVRKYEWPVGIGLAVTQREIEKAFGGVGGNSADGGTTQRCFGTFLTWMSERDPAKPVVIMATANNIASLPPELLRKGGRFDEIFFVDLPDSTERRAILDIHLRLNGVELDEGVNEVVAASKGFVGAEIAQAVLEARVLAHHDGAGFKGRFLLEAIEETKPLSVTMGDKINALREWAQTRARMASTLRASPAATPVPRTPPKFGGLKI